MQKYKEFINVQMDNDASGLLSQAIESIDKEIRSLTQERIVLERTMARFRHDTLHEMR